MSRTGPSPARRPRTTPQRSKLSLGLRQYVPPGPGRVLGRDDTDDVLREDSWSQGLERSGWSRRSTLCSSWASMSQPTTFAASVRQSVSLSVSDVGAGLPARFRCQPNSGQTQNTAAPTGRPHRRALHDSGGTRSTMTVCMNVKLDTGAGSGSAPDPLARPLPLRHLADRHRTRPDLPVRRVKGPKQTKETRHPANRRRAARPARHVNRPHASRGRAVASPSR